MRKVVVSLTAISFGMVVFGSSLVHKSQAGQPPENSEGNIIIQGTPGSRCTRLLYGPREKKKKGVKASPAIGTAGPGSRCLRLSVGPRKGKVLPNTPPKLGLSASTSYLSQDAAAEVRLKAIVCDLENDNVFYTYAASGGRIAGEGPDAVWDLSGVSRPGQYTVTVEVDDGCGCVTFTSAQVTVGN